jgi:hypothetical protein
VAKKKQKLFKDGPDGVQLHAGTFRERKIWHSDDGGKIWWSGYMFSHEAKMTTKELIKMAVSILQDVKE